MKNLFRALFCVCVVALWCCTHAPFSASAAEENLENLHIEMAGSSKLFRIDLKTDENVVIFYAEYPASRVLASYHTTGWYVTKEPTNNVSNIPKENKYYINVGKKPEPVNGSTHDYREDYSLGISFDTHKFSAKDVRGMLEKLFGENEDLTKPHTVYLQDVFVKKSRSSETAGWTYDWSGKQYSSLDEFLTMYDSYRNNPGMREQMSHYYNIPISISLSAANVKINFVDKNGNMLKASETVKVYIGDDLIYDVPKTIKKDDTAYKYIELKTDFEEAEVKDYKLTLLQVKEDTTVNLVYGNDLVEVTVEHLDEEDRRIRSDMILYAEKGEKLSIPIESPIYLGIDKYVYSLFDATQRGGKKVDDTIVFDSVEEKMTVTLFYEKEDTKEIAPPAATVTESSSTKSYYAKGPTASLNLKADARRSEAFDVASGIPTTESLYANGFTSEYLLDYAYKNVKGKFRYRISVTRTYKFINYVVVGTGEAAVVVPVTTYQTKTRTYTVTRPYSYWKVANFNVFTPSKMLAENGSLPGGAVTLNPYGLIKPMTIITVPSQNVIEPTHQNVTLPMATYHGIKTAPYEDWKHYAESAVGRAIVINDYLKFDGVEYMSNKICTDSTPAPTYPNTVGAQVGENVFYKYGLSIPYDCKNAIYSTKATVTYQHHYKYGGVKKDLAKGFTIRSTNKVTVHTPVVCNPIVTGADKYVQSTTYDAAKTNLILDGYFTVEIPTTGKHLDIKGYGTRDYFKYTFGKQVRFPFGVYDGDTYISPNTWYEISDANTFYVPTWVREGDYKIDMRTYALNADLAKLSYTGQTNANASRSKYVATASVNVNISGRVYGFQIYDVTDYPTWQSVFRKTNSLDLSGVTYRAGLTNRNGVKLLTDSKYTLPILGGSHPTDVRETVGTGYMFRYNLYTIGTTYDRNDYVSIKPSFYYVSEDGKTRYAVDVYYNESMNGTFNTLVKVGNALDATNIKTVSLGDPYMSVNSEELKDTASVLKTTTAKLRNAVVNTYTFSDIKLQSGLRTFVGAKSGLPASVGTEASLKSVQKWYGTFYLPSEIYLTRRGFDLESYSSKNSIDFTEDFWLGKDGGYLTVNFNISVYNNNQKVLTYMSGPCNMWKTEGFKLVKTDCNGSKFNLSYGDVLFYDLSESARKDYRPGGTH